MAKQGGWIFYEPGPQADSPLLGCFMVPIMLVAVAAFLFFIWQIGQAIL